MKDLAVIFRCCPNETDGNLSSLRPSFFSKFSCFKSVISCFYNKPSVKIYVVYDGNTDCAYYKYIARYPNLKILEINERNNQKSLDFCYQLAKTLPEDAFFFLEDDFLLLEKTYDLCFDALNIGIEIFSPFDHFDRYAMNNGDICLGKEFIVLGQKSHYRTAESTTCTCLFTKNIFNKLVPALEYFNFKGVGAPLDREFFRDIYRNGYRLFTALPTAATHMSLPLSPLVDWENFNNSIIL